MYYSSLQSLTVGVIFRFVHQHVWSPPEKYPGVPEVDSDVGEKCVAQLELADGEDQVAPVSWALARGGTYYEVT